MLAMQEGIFVFSSVLERILQTPKSEVVDTVLDVISKEEEIPKDFKEIFKFLSERINA